MKFRYREPHEIKDSGVEWLGMIPKEWEIKPLKRIYEKIIDYRGKTPKKVESGIQLVTAKNIKNGIIDYEISKEYVQEIEFDEIMQRGKVKINDLLFTTEAPLGELALVDREDFALAQRIILFRFYDSNIAKFSKYLLSSKLYKDYLYSNSSGSTALGIKGSKVPGLIYIQPNKYDLINSFLDQKTAEFDNIIAKKQAFIEKLTEAKKSLISEVVTGKKKLTVDNGKLIVENRKAEDMKDSGVEWFGMIPKEWGVSKLKYNCETVKGYAFKTELFKDEGHQIVKASDIKNNTILQGNTFIDDTLVELFEKVALKENDIVMSTVGSAPEVINSAVGQLALVPKEASGFLLNQNTVIFRIYKKVLDQNFIFYILSGNKFRKFLDLHAHGTANQASLTIKEILEFPICFPKIDEQYKVNNFLEQKNYQIEEVIKKTRLCSI